MFNIFFLIAIAIAVTVSTTGCESNVVNDEKSARTTPVVGNAEEALVSPTPKPSPTNVPVIRPEKSLYRSIRDYEGLYYVNARNIEDERKLVISYLDEPIGQKSNDPDEVTLPGFYFSGGVRFDFFEIEVIGKKVYFRTRTIEGVNFEFGGIAGQKIISDFDPDIPVPFITGTLKTMKDGRVKNSEKITFAHAVIY